MKPCDICGTRHESYQAHVFATNRSATNTSATNRQVAKSGDVLADAALAVPEVRGSESPSGGREVGLGRTRNRRDRDSYNAYQREYMRQKRLKARG